MKLGLLLPHFGEQANATRLISSAERAEALGFDSVWVRDHIVYRPHPYGDQDSNWLDPFVVLAAIAARTKRIALGTATLIPHRHPIYSAQLLASLASFADPSRLIVGWGRGADDREFETIGGVIKRRGAALEEQVSIVRQLWSGEQTSFHGEHYDFDDVSIRAPGISKPLRHWYGGASIAAVERAVRSFDGLLVSRIPRWVLKSRLAHMHKASVDMSREPPTVGLIVLVSPDDKNVSRVDLNLDQIIGEVARYHSERSLRTIDDLDGVLIRGTTHRLAEDVLTFARIGVDHLVLDLRLHFADWEACMELLGAEIAGPFRNQQLK